MEEQFTKLSMIILASRGKNTNFSSFYAFHCSNAGFSEQSHKVLKWEQHCAKNKDVAGHHQFHDKRDQTFEKEGSRSKFLLSTNVAFNQQEEHIVKIS